MAEYIEREALKNELHRRLKFLIAEYGEHDQYTSGFDDAMDKVEKFPAADVVPVVHGRWIPRVNPQWPAHRHDVCSVCRWWNTRNALCYDGNHKPGHSLNYCPNCGAKMDGEEQDDELIL